MARLGGRSAVHRDESRCGTHECVRHGWLGLVGSGGGMLRRYLSLFRRRRLDRELTEEVAAHLAMQEAEFRHAGLDPEAARLKSLREFGGVSQTQEAYRERRGVPWVETTMKDVRYALRGLK